MKFGLILFQTALSAAVVDVAIAAEGVGFDSIWLTEHTHIPTETVFARSPDGAVPLTYKSLLDPLISLAAAAQATRSIRLATGVLIVPEHEPILLAKQIATLDHLSGGRLILGIGAGWNLPELRNHGVLADDQFKVMREYVLAMKALWAEDVAEYRGSYVEFGPAWAYPKPTQIPHPPIIIGGMGPRVLHRVVEYGDGWAPIVSSWPPEPQLAERIRELRSLADEAGRQVPEVSVFGHPTDPDLDLPSTSEAIEHLADIGVDRIIWNVRDSSSEAALGRIEELGSTLSAWSS